MNSVIAVTYPRSGYHLTVDCLQRIVPEMTKSKDYNRCYRDGQLILYLSHDFDLDREIVDGQPYLMLYRHPIFSVASLAEYFVRHKRQYPRAWRAGFEKRLHFWRDHVRKWGLGRQTRPREVVLYEDLVAHPAACMQRIMRLFGLEMDVDHIAKLIAPIKIRAKRSMSSVPYVTDADIDRVHEVAGEEMKQLGITDEGSGVQYGNVSIEVTLTAPKRSPRRHPRRTR